MAKIEPYRRVVEINPVDARISGGASGRSPSAWAFGVIGDALADASSALLRERRRAERAGVRDMLNAAQDDLRPFLQDIYNRKGKDVLGSYEEAQDFLAQRREADREALANDQQRELYAASFDRLAQSSLNRVIAFESKGLKQYNRDTLDAQNATSIDDAVANYTDPEAIKSAEETITANTSAAAKDDGLDGQLLKHRVNGAVHHLYMTVLNTIEQDSPEAAEGFFEAHEDKFTPVTRAKIKQRLKANATAAWVRNEAIRLSSSELPLDQQLAEVDKIKDPKLADDVRRRLKMRAAEKETAKKTQERQFLEEEWDKLYANPGDYAIPYTRLPFPQQLAMETYQSKFAQTEGAKFGVGRAPKTDPALYHQLTMMDQDEFLKLDLLNEKYVKKLSVADFKTMVKSQRDLRLGKKDAFRARSINSQITDRVRGLDELDVDTEEGRQRMSAYRIAADNEISRLKPAERTSENIDKIIDKLLEPATIDKFLFDDTIYRFEIGTMKDPRKKEAAYRANIPENLRDYRNVAYDAAANVYYVDGDGIRHLFDVNGNLVKSFRDPRTRLTADTPATAVARTEEREQAVVPDENESAYLDFSAP